MMLGVPVLVLAAVLASDPGSGGVDVAVSVVLGGGGVDGSAGAPGGPPLALTPEGQARLLRATSMPSNAALATTVTRFVRVA